MPRAYINRFGGLNTGQGSPPFESARTAQNVNLRRVQGQLELETVGYSAIAGLPAFPTPVGISGSPTWLDIHSFVAATPEGDKTFYVLAGTFARTTTGWSGSNVSQFSLFITPWYDGSTWQTGSWRELTEMYACKVSSLPSASTITLQNTPAFPAALQAADYFNGWVAVKGNDFTTDQANFLHISDYTYPTITIFGDTANLAGWAGGDEVYLYRNFFNKAMPTTFTGQLRTLFDELRATTGNASTDLTVAGAYRNKTMAWTEVIKGLFADVACLNINSRAFLITDVSIANEGTDPLPEGEYELRASLALDDNQETELRAINGTISGTALQETLSGVSCVASVKDSIYAGGYIYFIAGNILYKIDPATNMAVAVIDFGAQTYALCEAGTNIIVSVYSGAGTVLKTVAKASFAVTQTSPATYEFASKRITSDGTKVWSVRLLAGSWYVIEYTISSNTWTAISSALASGTIWNVIGNDGTYLYILDEIGSVVRVTISGYTISATASSAFPGASVWDWRINSTYIFIGCTDGKLYRVTVATMTADGSVYDNGAVWPGVRGIALSTTYVWLNVGGPKLLALNAAGDTLIASYTRTTTAASNGQMVTSSDTAVHLWNSDTIESAKYSINVAGGTTAVLSGQAKLLYGWAISPSLVPSGAAKLRLYISKDGGDFFLIDEQSIKSDGIALTGPNWIASVKHHYYKPASTVELVGADFTNAVDLAQTNLGRAVTDTGIIQYKNAVASGQTVYAAGVRLGGDLLRNKIMVSAIGGAASFYDVFPNDVSTVLDVDYNDGDQVVAVGLVSDRVLVLKNNSIVLLTPSGSGYNRDLVAQGIGIIAFKTLQSFNDNLYWLDESGVFEFSTQGLNLISAPINDTIKGLSKALKQAAISGLDREELLYIVQINSVQYVFDLRSREWSVRTAPTGHSTVAFSLDLASQNLMALMSLSGTYSIYIPAADTLPGGASWDWVWESNDLFLPEVGGGYDMILQAVSVEWDCNDDISLAIIETDNAAASTLVTHTLAAGSAGVTQTKTFYCPLSSRMKQVRLKFSGTRDANSDVARIKRVALHYDIIPAFGRYGV